MCNIDEPILNSSVWSKFVDNIENLAAKLENISDRLTAIYCIGSCVRKFPFSNLSTNQDSYDILVRISIQFIQLLQDNEKIIRNASVVQITKLATMFLNEMNQNMSPQKNCIRLFVQIMMTGTENQNRIQQTIRAIFQIALHFLANDNTLESCSSARLFDKTKMNIFIDEYSIWMDLIDELYLYCQQQQIIESKLHNITLEIFLKQSDDYICKQFEKIESELNHAKDLDDENTEFIYSDRSIRRKKFLQLFQRLI